jgi:uncharacterized protein (DUF2252 family)
MRAYWVKGCSSLGRVRYAALVRVANGYRLIDIKEAAKTIDPPIDNGEMPSNNAQRVVMGSQHLSPFLVERTIAANLDSHQVVIRELRPQDVKIRAFRAYSKGSSSHGEALCWRFGQSARPTAGRRCEVSVENGPENVADQKYRCSLLALEIYGRTCGPPRGILSRALPKVCSFRSRRILD